MSQMIDWNALWKKDATANVGRNEFLPCIEVFPELLDGSINQGNATKIDITYNWKDDGTIDCAIKDNGKGTDNERRLLTWASSNSVDSTHRNGNGLKFALTKFIPDQAKDGSWQILSRKKNRDRVLYMSPFRGPDTTIIDETEDSKERFDTLEQLLPSGFLINVSFSQDIFKDYSPEQIFKFLKEKICSTYSEEILRRVTIDLECVQGQNIFKETSNSDDPSKMWHSFEYECANDKDVAKMYVKEMPEKAITMSEYFIKPDGHQSYNLKKKFPIFGRKNEECQNILISQNGRMISAIKISKVLGKEPHGAGNGRIIFVNFKFDPKDFDKFPRPASIKNAFWEGCPLYNAFLRDLQSWVPCSRKAKIPTVEPPMPKETVPIVPMENLPVVPKERSKKNASSRKAKIAEAIPVIQKLELPTVEPPMPKETVPIVPMENLPVVPKERSQKTRRTINEDVEDDDLPLGQTVEKKFVEEKREDIHMCNVSPEKRKLGLDMLDEGREIFERAGPEDFLNSFENWYSRLGQCFQVKKKKSLAGCAH